MKESKELIELSLKSIQDILRDLFGDATCVELFLNESGMETTIKYRTGISGYSMRNIDGSSVSKRENT